jgi:hypothetical protein
MEVSMEIDGERLEFVAARLESASLAHLTRVEQVGFSDMWLVTISIPVKGMKRWIKRHERLLVSLGFPEIWEAKTLKMLESLEFMDMANV